MLVIEAVAYSKILLHCAKYPWNNVFGILICSENDDSKVVDVFPLVHSPLLNPSLEVALLLILKHCEKTNTKICGGYYSGEQAALPIVQKLLSQLPGKGKSSTSNLLIVDNAKEKSLITSHIVSSGESLKASKFQVDSASIDKFKLLLAKGQASKLVDFDDCLEDSSKDFRNPGLIV